MLNFAGMSETTFRFKRFSVGQEHCGMKVGTDGVLLGAWAAGGRNILDAGTGSGVIALMMAQRFAGAGVTAIDIDQDACRQAAENVAASPFADRIKVECCSLQAHTASGRRYDAIVSNPPYFDNSLKASGSKRAMARHTDTLSYRDLMKSCRTLLDVDGTLSLVMPADIAERVISEASLVGMCLTRRCDVRTVMRKPAKRVLLSFSTHFTGAPVCEEHSLLDAGGSRSDWYRKLTEDFYIK